jgi:NifU-like protein involved in Fe-S cluster formation
MYPKIVMEHFLHPKNVGKIENPTSTGSFTSISGGKAVFYLNIENSIAKDVKYQVAGCPFAIAVCSIISEYALGKSISELKEISKHFLSAYFDFTDEQEECINLALFAFLESLKDF